MTNIKRKPAQRAPKTTSYLEFREDPDCAELLQPTRSSASLVDNARCLSLILNTSTFEIDGSEYLDRIDDVARGLCGLSRNSLITKAHFELSFYRFTNFFPRDDERLQRRIDNAWNSLGTVFSRDDSKRLLKSCLVYKTLGEVTPTLLNYILDEPAPDFLTLNRLHGWTEEMNDPAYFYLAGNGLLLKQVNGIYGL